MPNLPFSSGCAFLPSRKVVSDFLYMVNAFNHLAQQLLRTKPIVGNFNSPCIGHDFRAALGHTVCLNSCIHTGRWRKQVTWATRKNDSLEILWLIVNPLPFPSALFYSTSGYFCPASSQGHRFWSAIYIYPLLFCPVLTGWDYFSVIRCWHWTYGDLFQ